MIEIDGLDASFLEMPPEFKVISEDAAIILLGQVEDRRIGEPQLGKQGRLRRVITTHVSLVQWADLPSELGEESHLGRLAQLARKVTHFRQDIGRGDDIFELSKKSTQKIEILDGELTRTFEPGNKIPIERANEEEQHNVCINQYLARTTVDHVMTAGLERQLPDLH
ncbi:MAG: hypothetical protein JW888_06125 [Pirellulales bacterium]|nr:hypothetical protein [Pirellulales bacterium]